MVWHNISILRVLASQQQQQQQYVKCHVPRLVSHLISVRFISSRLESESECESECDSECDSECELTQTGTLFLRSVCERRGRQVAGTATEQNRTVEQ